MDNQFEPQQFFNGLKEKCVPFFGDESFRSLGREEWERQFRSELRDALGLNCPVLSSPDEPIRKLSSRVFGEYAVEKYSVPLFDGVSFPLYTMEKNDGLAGKIPVLACHGHGPGADALMGLDTKRECHNYFGRRLADGGFLAVMPEFLGFGECRFPEDKILGAETNSCHALASWLLPWGLTLAGVRVKEAQAALAFIGETLKPPGGMGIFGFSGGGLIAALAAALDPDISYCALAGFGSTFRLSIMESLHCPDNYIPRLGLLCEFPDLARLICPRPLYMETAAEDGCFPLSGTNRAHAALEKLYRAEGCSERLIRSVPKGPHRINGEGIIDWLKEIA